ncbi:winged helix-turn-helix domain-containing protein [Salinirubellus sp. GCM10025818]|uniref:winged helix-turn-helix domain-containing protein n=1 Tax=Salinirubellus TaxID=2162630 RepID=UPI0030D38271
MEKALWYLLAGTRGGPNRVRLIRAIEDRPRNANQLAEYVGLDYNTVRHHLDMLLEHDVIERSGDEYGALYFLTDRFERHRETFEQVTERMDVERAEAESGTESVEARDED